MKRFIKTITMFTIMLSLVLSSVPNTFAAYDGEANETAAALALLEGVTEWHGEGHLMRFTASSGVTENDDGTLTVFNDNPWNFNNSKWTLSKEALLKALAEEIEKVGGENKKYSNSVYFDKSILSGARGKFYESYVCEYWRRINNLTKELTGYSIEEVDKFFKVNCIDPTNPIDYGDGVFVCAASLFNFTDLTTAHWAMENIARMAHLGYFSGYEDNSFKPDDQITHEEFTKVIVEIAGLKPQSDAASVAKWASWAQPYLDAAIKAGIITENDTDIMQANTPITRGEMAKLIGRLRVYLKSDDDENAEPNDTISDWNTISDEYKPYIAKAYNAGIINGYSDGSFKPNDKLTRAEASTVFIKLIDEQESFKLFVNGKLFRLSNFSTGTTFSDVNAEITDKDILVPMRRMAEEFEIALEWDNNTETIIFEKDGYGTCRTVLCSNVIEKKDGDKWVVCAEDIEPSAIVNDRTIVPLFAVVKALGMDISYDKATNSAEVNYVDAPTP